MCVLRYCRLRLRHHRGIIIIVCEFVLLLLLLLLLLMRVCVCVCVCVCMCLRLYELHNPVKGDAMTEGREFVYERDER